MTETWLFFAASILRNMTWSSSCWDGLILRFSNLLPLWEALRPGLDWNSLQRFSVHCGLRCWMSTPYQQSPACFDRLYANYPLFWGTPSSQPEFIHPVTCQLAGNHRNDFVLDPLPIWANFRKDLWIWCLGCRTGALAMQELPGELEPSLFSVGLYEHLQKTYRQFDGM